MPEPQTYEYAGFLYSVPDFEPLPDQHPAAAKERHRQAARECYADDQRREKKARR